MITSEQIRAARAILRWRGEDLAEAANVSYPTIQRIEKSNGVPRSTAQTLMAIQSALEKAGIEFSSETETAGPCVRLRKPEAPTKDS